MSERPEPAAIVTSSAIIDIALIFVGSALLDSIVVCLPMILSLISALSPTIALSITAEFSISTFFPIFE